ncbi:probable pectinesterase/pectinesterase inhibitor 61 [Magnolia sinica]|uniref:probable pectinesterase/pectinesterase inhibitor 61 n=1 Tax=Magnolia sinica TaxID=86752 RepID=UPI002658CEBE|nr:probable pectinesterase/pectinesterase inhibitor 61 [Magnolia sinica]
MALYQLDIISFSFIIIVASIISLDVEAHHPRDKISEACKNTRFPHICEGTAMLIPKSNDCGVTDIAKMSIQATLNKITEAKAITAKMMEAQTEDDMAHSSFEVCQQAYQDAIDALKESIKNMDARSHVDLMDNLSAAMSAFSTCDDGFAEATGEDSPLADVNSILTKLTSNSLALGEHINLKHH